MKKIPTPARAILEEEVAAVKRIVNTNNRLHDKQTRWIYLFIIVANITILYLSWNVLQMRIER